MNTYPTSIVRQGFKALVVTLVVSAMLMLGVSSPASAASPAAVTSSVHTVVSHSIAPVAARPMVNGTALCSAAATGGYRFAVVAAFAIGYCPTWGFFQTSWGRSVGNYVTNVACHMPWFVWAASGGRFTTC